MVVRGFVAKLFSPFLILSSPGKCGVWAQVKKKAHVSSRKLLLPEEVGQKAHL